MLRIKVFKNLTISEIIDGALSRHPVIISSTGAVIGPR
jgi:hypothetical protein